MKKAKKTTARKTLLKKVPGKKMLKAHIQSKAKIQLATKAEAPVKRKAASKSRTSAGATEERRGVIPDSAKTDSWTDLTQESHPKKTISRKVAGKKPIFPLGHSD
ncbi:MAG: hypothetical protein H7Z71_00440 [Moraxellaceae bacterium]|nr:hypothetical protein [Pseudobdellovibrionaceae bacterium]